MCSICATPHNICQERSDEIIKEDNIINTNLGDEREQRAYGYSNFRKGRDADVLREILTSIC